MKALTIIGDVVAKKDKIEFMRAELEKLIPITRAEKGCINYDLHQDNENKAHFLFYENWESRELWQDHMNNDHLKAFIKTAEENDTIDKFTVYEMTKQD